MKFGTDFKNDEMEGVDFRNGCPSPAISRSAAHEDYVKMAGPLLWHLIGMQLDWRYVVAFIRSSFVSSFSIQSLDIFLEVTSISYIAAPAHPNPSTSLHVLHTILHWIYWAHMKGHIMSVFYSDLLMEFAPKYSEIILT